MKQQEAEVVRSRNTIRRKKSWPGGTNPRYSTLGLCDVAGWQAVPCFSRSCVDTTWPFDLTLYIIDARPMPVGYDHDLLREQRGLPLLFPAGHACTGRHYLRRGRLLGAPIAFRSPCPWELFRPSTLPFGHLGSQSCHFRLARIRSCVE